LGTRSRKNEGEEEKNEERAHLTGHYGLNVVHYISKQRTKILVIALLLIEDNSSAIPQTIQTRI
jgi:hypothetical protein